MGAPDFVSDFPTSTKTFLSLSLLLGKFIMSKGEYYLTVADILRDAVLRPKGIRSHSNNVSGVTKAEIRLALSGVLTTFTYSTCPKINTTIIYLNPIIDM